ncbi:hypothetical protein DL768_001180 [Monosporascus sp. mg162]|nr:hypothetical protein DL768_001180 [Monosporascus sp. mg162]
MYNLTPADGDKRQDPEAARQAAAGRQCEWTRMHSWYAVMGGFAIDLRNLPRDFVPGSPRSQILSTDGLLLLARCKPELIPDISEEEILDKSKADRLKKFIICLQAAWFSVSAIFRMARGYPIALLELNTFAHALCALLIYCIWWSKPLDVAGSTLIDGRLCDDIVAFLAMASHYNGRREMELFRYQPAKTSRPRVRFDPKLASGGRPYWTSSATLDCADDNGVQARLTIPEHDPGNLDRACQLPDAWRVLQMWQTLYGFCFEVRSEKPPRSPRSVKRRPYIVLKAGDMLRWRRASQAVERFLRHEEAGQSYINFRGDSDDIELNPDGVPDLLVDRIHNWPTNILSFSKFRKRHLPTHIALILANAFYGGLHFVAADAPFGTETERKLWIISSSGLLASGPGAVLVLYSNFLIDPYYRFLRWLSHGESAWDAVWRRKYMTLGRVFMRARLVFYYLPMLTALLLFSRVFLIVECFLNLSQLDPKVFAIPSWVEYFPHIN